MKPLSVRKAMVEKVSVHSLSRQCRLLSVHRSGLYYRPRHENEENLAILRLLDKQYFKTPFYGVRRLTYWLRGQGYAINPKRTRRLMELVGWQTLYRRKNTSKRDKQHPVYPYLLKNLAIERNNQVWATDITFIPMQRGFMYLCAIIDLNTRYVLNWSLSNAMTGEWCRQVAQEAIQIHGQPEIINTDQGSQFTSHEFTSLFTQRNQPVSISMDSKGRCIDNIFIERLWKSVKYECVYLNAYRDGIELYQGLKEYFDFYNHQRLHQSLGYKTPASLYNAAA